MVIVMAMITGSLCGILITLIGIHIVLWNIREMLADEMKSRILHIINEHIGGKDESNQH